MESAADLENEESIVREACDNERSKWTSNCNLILVQEPICAYILAVRSNEYELFQGW